MIGELLQGDVRQPVILGVLIVKAMIWAVSLGSGTSGGVLAPLLMMGGALGGAGSHGSCRTRAPASGRWSAWAPILGGTMRSPLTGIVFALELTHDINVLLPLLVAVVVAHGFTVLVLRRSILTEKVAAARLPSQPRVRGRPAGDGLRARGHAHGHRGAAGGRDARGGGEPAAQRLSGGRQRLYPVVAADQRLIGVVTRTQLRQALAHPAAAGSRLTVETLATARRWSLTRTRRCEW